MRVPAMLAALPLVGGCAAGVLLVDLIPERVVLAFAAAAAFTLLAACGFLYERLTLVVATTAACGFASAGLSLGASCARGLAAPPLLAWFEAHLSDEADPVTVVGVLRDDAARSASGVSLTLETGGGGLRLGVGGVVPGAALDAWRAGRTVRLPALLRRPTTFHNPGVPDDARVLARRGIALVGTVKSAALVDVVAPGGAVEEWAARLRARVRSALAQHVGRHDGRSAGIAAAILIGDRTGLAEEDERRMQAAGTYHVIAISGGNIAILTALLLATTRVLRAPPRAGALICIGVLLFYGEVAGGAASVSRAISAAIVFLAALALDHRGRALNTVAVAAILAVAVSPVAVVDPGFLLSFGATAGIILGVPRLVPRGRTVRVALAATLSAEVALAPVAASFFSRITVAGLVLNLAAIPLMTVVQIAAMAVVAVSSLHVQTADALGVAVHHAAAGLVESARLIDVAPWLARDVPPPAWWLCVLYYLACGGLFFVRTRRVCSVAFGLATLLLLAGPGPATHDRLVHPAGLLRVVVLDVGQGDATAVILPDGRALVVDAGGVPGTTFDIGGRVVTPALRALGVRRLEALVITHADPDHIGGAEAVMRNLRPAAVWEGVPVPPHPVLHALSAAARGGGTAWRSVRPGFVERLGDVAIRVLHPPEPEWERQRVRNDDSVVLEVRYGDVSILLPGDIGREVERTLIPAPGSLGRHVILKAAHHGSATSSDDAFIEATRPRAVIFSAGRRNMFGHPAPAVVERFTRRGIPTFNTARDGAVFVDTDGRTVRVWGWGHANQRQPRATAR